MTKDYAKPSTTRTSANAGKKPARKKPATKGTARRTQAPPPPKRGKLFFILALLIAAFGFGIYTLQKIPATITPEASPDRKANNTAQQKASPAAVKEPEQRFKFYDLLPESEVVPPKVDSYTFKEKSTSNDYYYLVQTGSFRSSADAERQKATIAFKGLKATIKPIQNAQGSTWYRVMTGPFYSRSEMNSALDKLVSIQIEPLVKKVKK